VWEFTEDDIAKPGELVRRLRDGGPLHTFLWGKIPKPLRERVKAEAPSSTLVADVLNALVKGDCLYEEEVWEEEAKRSQASRLARRKAASKVTWRVNCVLLSFAFADELSERTHGFDSAFEMLVVLKSDISGADALARKLQGGAGVHKRLWERIPQGLQNALTGPAVDSDVLAEALNRLIEGECLYEADTFAHLKLTDEIRELLEATAASSETWRANSLLLGQIFRKELKDRIPILAEVNCLFYQFALLPVDEEPASPQSRQREEDLLNAIRMRMCGHLNRFVGTFRLLPRAQRSGHVARASQAIGVDDFWDIFVTKLCDLRQQGVPMCISAWAYLRLLVSQAMGSRGLSPKAKLDRALRDFYSPGRVKEYEPPLKEALRRFCRDRMTRMSRAGQNACSDKLAAAETVADELFNKLASGDIVLSPIPPSEPDRYDAAPEPNPDTGDLDVQRLPPRILEYVGKKFRALVDSMLFGKLTSAAGPDTRWMDMLPPDLDAAGVKKLLTDICRDLAAGRGVKVRAVAVRHLCVLLFLHCYEYQKDFCEPFGTIDGLITNSKTFWAEKISGGTSAARGMSTVQRQFLIKIIKGHGRFRRLVGGPVQYAVSCDETAREVLRAFIKREGIPGVTPQAACEALCEFWLRATEQTQTFEAPGGFCIASSLKSGPPGCLEDSGEDEPRAWLVLCWKETNQEVNT